MTLKIRTIDHAVVMASDMERSISFYCDTLGGTPRYLERFRSGKIPVLPIQLGGAVINLQYLDEPAYLVAETLVHLQFFHSSKRLRRSGFVHTPTVAVNEHVASSFDMVFHDIDSLREALEVTP